MIPRLLALFGGYAFLCRGAGVEPIYEPEVVDSLRFLAEQFAAKRGDAMLAFLYLVAVLPQAFPGPWQNLIIVHANDLGRANRVALPHDDLRTLILTVGMHEASYEQWRAWFSVRGV